MRISDWSSDVCSSDLFSSVPSNDVWVTEDGSTWRYANDAQWSPRAWHAAVAFKGSFFVMGGTPLNNEVWKISSIQTDGTKWNIKWMQVSDKNPWSPRSGLQVIRHFGTSLPLSASMAQVQAKETLVLTGGYDGKSEERREG